MYVPRYGDRTRVPQKWFFRILWCSVTFKIRPQLCCNLELLFWAFTLSVLNTNMTKKMPEIGTILEIEKRFLRILNLFQNTSSLFWTRQILSRSFVMQIANFLWNQSRKFNFGSIQFFTFQNFLGAADDYTHLIILDYLNAHIYLTPVWPDWAIFALWATFSSLWQQLICPNLPKSLIFLVKSFLGNFYRHLAIFFWSHWLTLTFQMVIHYFVTKI